jgi:hypothetical protein
MKHHNFVLTLAFALAAMSWAGAAAQNTKPTATRELQLSAFGAASGVYTGLSSAGLSSTGLSSGKNLSITAGADLGLPPWRGMRPTIEVRGTYPIDKGTVDSQRDILGGLRVDFLLNHRFRPYGDFLFGRGQINYGNGYPFNGYFYALTTTYVDSPGGGFNYDLTDHWGIKVDGQFQRWGGPAPTQSGIIYSKVGTVGVVYTFTFDRRHRR